jgi:hypothetical protein
MDSIRFAGQLTEPDYRRICALAGRKVVLAWTALIAILFVFLLTRWSWEAVQAEPLYTSFVFGSLPFVIPVSLALRPLMLRRHWRSNAILRQPVKGIASEQGLTWDVYVAIGQFLYFLPRYFSDPPTGNASRSSWPLNYRANEPGRRTTERS